MSKKNDTRTGRSQNRRSSKNKKKIKKFSWKKLIGIIIAIGIVIGLILGGIGLSWAMTAPEITNEDLTGSISSIIYDKDGNEIYETSENERIIVTEEDISQQTFDAVTSIEDQRFLKHNGFDPIRILGAFVANLQSGGISQGGSTLTQQLVKLSVFSTNEEDQTYKRKVQEIAIAINLENEFTKQEIFEFYINKVYMANGIYGMGTAAEIYFGQPLNQLTLAQTALLAGMPQAPNSYDPYTEPEAAEERRNTVLYTMLDNEKITQAEYDQAIQTPIDDGLQPLQTQTEQEDNLNQVIDPYIKQVAKEIEEEGYDLYSDGLKVYTHLDLDAQQYIYDTVNDAAGNYFPNNEMQAAVSVLDTDTGHITALFGGRNQEGALNYNRATEMTSRDIGSSIKPFSAYGPAIEYLNLSTGSSIEDEPFSYSNGLEVNNVDMQFYGWMTLRDALIQSRNIPPIKLVQEVGSERVAEFMDNIGLTMDVHESTAISGPTSPLALSAAYATLGNYGEYNEPKAVDYFEALDGETVEVAGESRQAMKDSTAYMLTDILKDSFTDGILNPYGNPSLAEAGKSGTSNYTEERLAANNIDASMAPDHWMNGYTTNYAISIWTGYDEQTTPLSVTDFQIANHLYRDIMDYLSAGLTTEDWTQPSSVHEVDVVTQQENLEIATPQIPSGRVARNELINDEMFAQLQDQINATATANRSRQSSANRVSSQSSSRVSSSSSSVSASSSSESSQEDSISSSEESSNTEESSATSSSSAVEESSSSSEENSEPIDSSVPEESSEPEESSIPEESSAPVESSPTDPEPPIVEQPDNGQVDEAA